MKENATISIRTVEAIDAELYDLALALEGSGAAVDDIESRIDSDQYDAGRVDFAKMPRSRDGRLLPRTSTLNASTYITAARQRRAEWTHERAENRRRIADLRAERRLWTDRTPLGMTEIAELLGYPIGTPRQWKRRQVLPTPAGYVSGTPYWWRGDVLGWALERGRTRAIVQLEREDDTYANDYSEVA
jgi:hypothetical protein